MFSLSMLLDSKSVYGLYNYYTSGQMQKKNRFWMQPPSKIFKSLSLARVELDYQQLINLKSYPFAFDRASNFTS
jgi:hypothetical protein